MILSSTYLKQAFGVYLITYSGGDIRPALAAACAEANMAGGGEIVIESGEHVVTCDPLVAFTAINFNGYSNLTVRSRSPESTKITLGNSQNAHIFNLTNTTNIIIADLAIDGNYLNQTSLVHGIRGDGVDGLILDNVKANNCRGYNVGLQSGTIKNIRIAGGNYEYSGEDNIDIKNLDDINSNVFVGSSIALGNPSLVTIGKVCLDMRGNITADGIHITNIDATDVGIRIRSGELLSVNGLGGMYSSLSNFSIDCDSSGSNVPIGILVDHRYTKIGHGIITNPDTGIQVASGGVGCRVHHVDVVDPSVDGFELDSTEGVVSDCNVIAETINFSRAIRVDGNNNTIRSINMIGDYNGGIGTNSTTGININTGVTGTKIRDRRDDGNINNVVNDLGTGTSDT